jgi:hypothetical protein
LKLNCEKICISHKNFRLWGEINFLLIAGPEIVALPEVSGNRYFYLRREGTPVYKALR